MYLIQLFQESPQMALIYILSILLAMCVAISFHEWAHAYVAYKLGDPTAKNMGRMTLDPLKHLDWLGVLCFLFFQIGWAKPVIVNPRNLKHYRRDDIFISIAGPLMNLLLSFVFYGIWLFTQPVFGVDSVVSQILSTIFYVNIAFAIFNIIPIPPLDGFHVFTSIFVKKNYKVVDFLKRYGIFILLALLFLGVFDVILGTLASALQSVYFAFFSLFL